MNSVTRPKSGRLAEARPRPAPHLGDFTTRPRVLFVAAIAVIVGTAGFSVGVLLLHLIRLFTNLAYFQKFSFAAVDLGGASLGYWTIAVPVVGALAIGLMARFGSEKIRGHGIPEAIEAILLGRSRLDLKVAVLKPLSSAISIGTGGPFGAEGPIIMTGGALGSLIAQLLPVSDAERRTLLVAGAAAGMTTVFGTPIAAIMLSVELLLFEWTPRSFVPVAAAAITAAIERAWLVGPLPLFPFHGGMAISATGLGCWVLVGLLSGLLSGGLTQFVYGCEDLFLKLPIHWMWWPALGGVVIGIGGLVDPAALGVGYASISQMLHGDVVPAAGLLLLAVKAVIWAVALGSGTSGGVLAPLLIFGGSMGTALAHVMPAASPGFWALLGMAATMGGTMRSPLTAIFFATEVTGDTHMLLPLTTACVTAHLVTVLLMRRSILTEKIARRGHHLLREYRVDPFALTRVAEVMTTEVETLPDTTTLHQATAFLTQPTTRHPSFPVVDAERRVVGIVDPPAILAWRRSGNDRHATLGAMLKRAKVPTGHPDEYLESVVGRMSHLNVAHLAIVSRVDGSLVGYLGWRDLLRVRAHEQRQDSDRMAFFRWRGWRRRIPALPPQIADRAVTGAQG